MNCIDFRKAIHRYADKEISKEAGEAMRQHAETCTACNHELAELEQLGVLLTTSPTPGIPADLANSIMRRARQLSIAEQAPRVLYLPVWWDELTRPARIAAAVLLALGLSLGALMGWDVNRNGRSPSSTADRTDALAAYNLDYLDDAPAGSLAQVVMTLNK